MVLSKKCLLSNIPNHFQMRIDQIDLLYMYALVERP